MAHARRDACGAARGQIGGHVQPARSDIDGHHVAFAQLRDRAAVRGFRRHVADHETVGGAAETAVGDQGDIVAQPLADQRRGHRQHLAHAGTAGRAFESDHHDVASVDLPRLHRGERGFFAVEYARRTCVLLAAVAGELDDAAVRREIAVEDRIAAARLDRIADRTHYVLRRRCRRGFRVRKKTLAGDRRDILDQTGHLQCLHHQCGAALFEHFRRGVAAARLQVGDHRGIGARRFEFLQIETHAGFVRDRQQMQRGVGRTRGRRHRACGVAQRGQTQQLARRGAAVAQQFHDQLAASFGGLGFFGMGGRDVVLAQRRQAQEGQHHRHRVCGELAAAGARAGAGLALDVVQFGIVDLACCVRAYGLEHVLHCQRAFAAVLGCAAARHDRAAVEDHRRDIQPRRCHRRRGNGLVAAHQQHHRIEAVAGHREFDRIGDGFARRQRGAHAVAAHRDAVGDGDGVEFDRRAAAGDHAAARVLGQVAQGDVAGGDIGPGVDHPDEGLGDGRIVEAGGAQHGARRGAGGSVFDRIAEHVAESLKRVVGNVVMEKSRDREKSFGKFEARKRENPRTFFRGGGSVKPGLSVAQPYPAPVVLVIRTTTTRTSDASATLMTVVSMRLACAALACACAARCAGACCGCWMLRCVMTEENHVVSRHVKPAAADELE